MAKLSYTTALAAWLWISEVLAHGAVTSYTIDGKDYPGYDGYNPGMSPATIEWQWPSYDPILDPSSKNIMCNGGTSAKLSAPVNPGSTVIAKWKQWTHIPGSVAVYMYKCAGEFSACNGSGKGWFKIDEAGLLSGTMYDGTWGAGEVLNTGQWSTKIPATLAPGNYLIRHELIAVHQSNTPQFYPECAQLVVGGSGTASPTGGYLTSIPGYCKLSDSNVSFDIYSTAAKSITTWKVPGPPVWDGSNNPPPASATEDDPSPAPVETVGPAPPAQATGTVPLYGQCGGQGYSGPTACVSGTCVANGAYYSQCMP